MISFQKTDNSLEGAKGLDQKDPLGGIRDRFCFPKTPSGEGALYFAGHSLGLMPKATRKFIEEELDAWSDYGVEGHFDAKRPWLPYHENVTESLARLVGARSAEVVAMNTLTVNLHLMMVSFYRPTKSKFKILIENNTFPSDKYAVDSQARYHGFDSEEAVVELKPRPGKITIEPEDVLAQIDELGDSLALVMLGNCNYLSGQCFDMEAIVKAGHRHGAFVGFNLAHGAGNLVLDLHEWDVDFAVWCSYKYLNSGPGGIAGAFVHENHHRDPKIPRFEGWWGTNKETRFEMGPKFDAIPSVEAWQLSNPPIFQLASLQSSLAIFDEVTMPKIREKGDQLTAYLEWLLKENCGDLVDIQTPAYDPSVQRRGSMICVRIGGGSKKLLSVFKERNVLLDFREPDIFRITPNPLYCQYEEVFKLVEIVKEVSGG